MSIDSQRVELLLTCCIFVSISLTTAVTVYGILRYTRRDEKGAGDSDPVLAFLNRGRDERDADDSDSES